MNTVEKGNKLEDDFYDYLCDQQSSDELLYDVHSPQICKVFKKKKYFCSVRNADVEFDVVIELYRKGAVEPHSFVVFECKNYAGSVPEVEITDFSHKIDRIFGNAVKGVVVVASRLQSGAEAVANSENIGIAKFDANGVDVIAERTSAKQLFGMRQSPLDHSDDEGASGRKFIGFFEGAIVSSISEFLKKLISSTNSKEEHRIILSETEFRYYSEAELREISRELLDSIAYKKGVVDLFEVAKYLSIEVVRTGCKVLTESGEEVLGNANFDRRQIAINLHDNEHRERFTFAHEIGHFRLKHDKYLRSEQVLERDFFIQSVNDSASREGKLEFQANSFAAHLLLPEEHFREAVSLARTSLGLRNRGHGYLFVDDQECNYGPFNQLVRIISTSFGVSKQVVEIKLKSLGMLTDERTKPQRWR